MENEISMGKRIAEQRKKLGLTQNELADKLMISNKTISKWESNLGNPSLEFLPVLSDLFNCSLDYLIMGKDGNQKIKLKGTLPFIVGMDENDNYVTADLKDLIHLSITGSTGTGKSVFVHSLIHDLLDNIHQNYFKLALIDTTDYELKKYSELKNLIKPIGNNESNIDKILTTCNSIIDQRFEYLRSINKSSIDDFFENKQDSESPAIDLTRIVLIIDTMTEILYMDENYKKQIDRILAMGRAAGVHVVMTIRPFKEFREHDEYIFKSRLCGIVASEEDSIFTIGEPGAEYWNHPGEMLFINGNKRTKVKCKYHSDKEIEYFLEQKDLNEKFSFGKLFDKIINNSN